MLVEPVTAEERILTEIREALSCALEGHRYGGEFVSGRMTEGALIISLLDPNPFLQTGMQIAMVTRRDEGSAVAQHVNMNPDPAFPRIAMVAREAIITYLEAHSFARIFPRDCFWPVWLREIKLLA